MPDVRCSLIVRRAATLLMLVWLACCPGCACDDREAIRKALQMPARCGERARLEVVDGIPVAHLYGTGEEMARQYGTLLKPALQALEKYGEKVFPPGLARCFVAQGKEVEATLPAELRAQLRAIAEAAEVPYEFISGVNLVPNIMCSTLAMWGPAGPDGELIMGRNVDYPAMGLAERGSLVLVCHSTDAAPVVLVSFLGMMGGFTGINAEGVCFGNMVIFNASGPESQAGGLPIQLAMRIAGQQSGTAREMVDDLRATRHIIPMSVMVADRTEALVVELGLTGSRVRGGDRVGVLAASNYFLVHPDQAWRFTGCPRHKSLLRDAEEHHGAMTPKDMGEALYDARFPTMNLQAVIFEPSTMKMHISINRNPAAAGPYHEFDVQQLLAE
ncbi:MAG: C45 family autoproteolytic acyltransferase/hydrolase [Planctomycetota bacterium]|jgi:hypothetical protein